jgi:hypothetical protein
MKAESFCGDARDFRENKLMERYLNLIGGIRSLLQSNNKKPGGHRAMIHKWSIKSEDNIPQDWLQF